MPSFADSIFLFVLALLLFGPKKLPVLARELGKWVGEFRRASNEFKMQMEDELRASEQTERQKQIAAMEAAAPVPPPLGEPAEEEHPHLRPRANAVPTLPPEHVAGADRENGLSDNSLGEHSLSENGVNEHSFGEHSFNENGLSQNVIGKISEFSTNVSADSAVKEREEAERTPDDVRPLPIATSGELHMMPPATGLPTPRGRDGNPLGGGLLDAIPEAAPAVNEVREHHEAQQNHEAHQIHEIRQETTAHGD